MGLEVITQPQLFMYPITALGGYFGINEAWPLLTTYQSWTSTASVNASAFPIPGTWTMIDEPGSFIVTVGGVYQPSSEYTVSRTFRTLTFNSLVSAGVEIAAQQLATAAPSAQNFNYIQSVSASIQSLSARTGTFDTLLVTNLTGLSTVVNIIDVRISEVSGFRSTGDVQIDGNVTVSRNIYLSGDLYLGTGDQIITPAINATNATITNTTVTNLTGTNATITTLSTINLSALNFVLTDNGSLLGQTSATSISIGSLSARSLSLIHDPANDGVDPVLDIGETLTGSFSGFRVRYEEPTNILIGSSRTGTTVLTSFMINTATGQVGISGLPASGQALTVTGNISATGNISTTGTIKAANSPLNYQYFVLTTDGTSSGGSTFGTPITIAPNLIYDYTLYSVSLKDATAAIVQTILSGNNNFTIIDGAASVIVGTNNWSRDLKDLGTSSAHRLIPDVNYTASGQTAISVSARLSAATTCSVTLSTFSATGSVQPKKGTNARIIVIG